VFRQEYEAQFLEDSAGVFRGVDGCLAGGDLTANCANYANSGDGTSKGARVRDVVIGCDVAKHTDFTVLIAMDAASGRCFAMERFNHLDWPVQKERIAEFVRRHRGRLIMDATGVGDPVYDDLRLVCPDVEAFKFTAGSKVALVQRLIVAVEQREVNWPGGRNSTTDYPEYTEGDGRCLTANGANYANGDGSRAEAQRRGGGDGRPGSSNTRGGMDRGDPIRATGAPHAGGRHEIDWGDTGACWDVLTGEMKRFEYSVSPTGGISYSAPGGYHDDCVMALALANWGRWQMGQAGRMLPVPGGVVSGRRRGDGGGARRGSRGVRVLGRRDRCLVG